MTASCSSWLSVGLSPVVPQGTSPFTPPAIWASSSASNASQSIDWSSRKGVTSAVYVPSKDAAVMNNSSPLFPRRSGGEEQVRGVLHPSCDVDPVVPGSHDEGPAGDGRGHAVAGRHHLGARRADAEREREPG